MLSFLPAEQCRVLLTAAGVVPAIFEHLPDSGTTDPLLQSWQCVTHPPHCEDDVQRAALAACIDAAGMDAISHRVHAATAQFRRGVFLALQNADASPTEENHSVFAGLLHMWDGYLRHGRPTLQRLGKRTVVAPPLVPGFGTADLSVGRTLVEIKASVDPVDHLAVWLNQLLGYLLLDRLNVFCWEALAVYLGWHATTLTTPVHNLLTAATTGSTPALTDLS